MIGLPSGWVQVSLDEIAEVQGGIQKQQKRRPVRHKYPFLRVANVASGSLNLQDVHEIELFEGELGRFVLRPGDLLVVEGNGSVSRLGRAARWNGEIENCVHQNHLIRVRPGPAISTKFLEFLWNSPAVSEQLRGVAASTSGLYTLSTAKLKRVSIALPPLEEQRRIVIALEEQMSRLDAALRSVRTAKEGSVGLLQSIYDDAASGRIADAWQGRGVDADSLRSGWEWRTPSDLTDGLKENIVIGPFGSNLKVSDYEESGVPLVFVRNIRSGNFKSTKYVAPQKAEELGSHSVTFGDLLITKMGDPPGDAAVYREPEDGIVTADCIRLRPSVRWNVDYLAVAVNSTLVRRQIEAATRGVAQRKVSLARFRNEIRIPVPPEYLQDRVVEEVGDRVSKVRRVQEALARAEAWAEALRRSLLAEAFAGRLVPQDAADESAEALLVRIHAEREAAGVTKSRARSPRRAPTQRKHTPDSAPAADAPPHPSADARALATAIQPTLDMEIPS
ncbi:hypothetical protein DEJ44_26570 [Streptomyces venezuelae]|uniref:restriction endonuclease subunit S n=1 Tax=Streptomyces venezuelae TaxID=54571 RepID=UPI00123C3D85|nr:restriction endonuclease subunit S [Streptomyces venezuelae]QES08838.1 hypothetical protein DEJ44_26570 [Streptomyces venezuelae]